MLLLLLCLLLLLLFSETRFTEWIRNNRRAKVESMRQHCQKKQQWHLLFHARNHRATCLSYFIFEKVCVREKIASWTRGIRTTTPKGRNLRKSRLLDSLLLFFFFCNMSLCKSCKSYCLWNNAANPSVSHSLDYKRCNSGIVGNVNSMSNIDGAYTTFQQWW